MQTKADIYLLDEVLAVGDASFQEKCLEKINELISKGVTIVFVSHSLDTIKSFCTRAIWLDDGRIKSVGSADKVVSDYIQSMNKTTEEKKVKEKQKDKKHIIKKIEFLRNAKPSYYFKTGDKFTARIHYYANKEIKNPVIGIAIYRDDNIHITGPNTKASRFKIKRIYKKGSIDYIMKDFPLKNGHYLFSVGIFNWKNTRMYDFCDKEFSFRVKGGKQDTPYGLIKFNQKWHIN